MDTQQIVLSQAQVISRIVGGHTFQRKKIANRAGIRQSRLVVLIYERMNRLSLWEFQIKKTAQCGIFLCLVRG